MLNYAISIIDNALSSNPLCGGGLFIKKKAFGTHCGPSGGPEILAFLYSDDPQTRYWYGHVLRHPTKPELFVSMIVWSEQLVNAISTQLLFQRFSYWMTIRHEYNPCAVQNIDDAYDEAVSFHDAANSLARMIQRFDIEKRWPRDSGQFTENPQELRIMGVYGIGDARDANGCYPRPPGVTPALKVVPRVA